MSSILGCLASKDYHSQYDKHNDDVTENMGESQLFSFSNPYKGYVYYVECDKEPPLANNSISATIHLERVTTT